MWYSTRKRFGGVPYGSRERAWCTATTAAVQGKQIERVHMNVAHRDAVTD
jgi:hypothetical protein